MRVTNVRANRKTPGLRAQHLSGLQLVTQLCSGELRPERGEDATFSARRANEPSCGRAGDLEGGAIGSTVIVLRPGQLVAGHFTADVKTAGSCMLLAQAAVPCALLASHQPAASSPATPAEAAETQAATVLKLEGGTDAALAPPLGYTQHVLLPSLERLLGVSVKADCRTRGFFPQVLAFSEQRMLVTAQHPLQNLTKRVVNFVT